MIPSSEAMKACFCYCTVVLHFKQKRNTVVFWICEKLILLKLNMFHSLTAQEKN